MGRKSQTVATFAVRVHVPKDMTLEALQHIILHGTCGYNGGNIFQTDQVQVKLMKKETTYE